eukprot:3487954-Pyramimonas_sp.AAC.1
MEFSCRAGHRQYYHGRNECSSCTLAAIQQSCIPRGHRFKELVSGAPFLRANSCSNSRSSPT